MSKVDLTGAKTGTRDGDCDICGAPAIRAGWSNWPNRYFRRCMASNSNADADEFTHCEYPKLDVARRRCLAELERLTEPRTGAADKLGEAMGG